MNSKKPDPDRLWYIKIAASLIAVICTIKLIIPIFSFHTPEEAGIFSAENAAVKTAYDSTDETTNTYSEATIPEITTEKDFSDTEQQENNTRDSFETPEDILELQKEYLATFSSSEKAGTVEEVFFRTSGATDIIDNVSVRNATTTKKPDFRALIDAGPELAIENISEPVVLIFHTHTTESYLFADNGVFYREYQTRSTDNEKNMVRVGKEICKVLDSNSIGYIHDTRIYDESYDGAYSRSRVSVEKYLEEFPTIKIVIDVHRDAIYYSDTKRCKPTAEINGQKAAQLMIISGAEEGYITDFPHWEKNLRFSLCFQKTAEDMYPGLMKPLYFCQRKYNMDTSECSFLLEVGTDANTLEEAVYSGYLTGNVLTKIIKDANK